MPTTDALLAVILIAILLNLVLASALLVLPRLRGRAARRGSAAIEAGGQAASETTAHGSKRPAARAGVGMFGPAAPVTPTDPETGFDLPATWSRWLDEEDARIRRYRRSATVVLVEIEGIERIIERLGDGAASRLVPPVALNLSRHARETDRFARLAVGRFGVLLLETDEIQAINYVERIRNACDAWLEAGGVASRLSIGWAEANNSRSIEAAMQSAEDRLNADRRQRGAVGDGDDDLLADARASA
ncbi:MAG: diguanylate cyclase [Chloroflexi bacterium]|nr:MAG: diguanylate cyclase [Chloroflexota bacterium]